MGFYKDLYNFYNDKGGIPDSLPPNFPIHSDYIKKTLKEIFEGDFTKKTVDYAIWAIGVKRYDIAIRRVDIALKEYNLLKDEGKEKLREYFGRNAISNIYTRKKIDETHIIHINPDEYDGEFPIILLESTEAKIIKLKNVDKTFKFGWIYKCYYANTLDISNNDFEVLDDIILNAENLYKIIAKNNRIWHIDKLFKGRRERAGLELDLSDNNIRELPKDMGATKHISVLNLANNLIEKIPESFATISFDKLILSGNYLTKIPKLNYREIGVLDLSDNEMSDNDIEALRYHFPDTKIIG